MNRQNILTVVVILAVFALVLLVGTMDATDAEQEQEMYCEYVRDGVWPDYKQTYEEHCK